MEEGPHLFLWALLSGTYSYTFLEEYTPEIYAGQAN